MERAIIVGEILEVGTKTNINISKLVFVLAFSKDEDLEKILEDLKAKVNT